MSFSSGYLPNNPAYQAWKAGQQQPAAPAGPVMNPYNGGQNLFNFLPGGYYNPDGTGTVPGMKDDPALFAFVSQMLQLLDGGLNQAEMNYRDNWLRENGYGAMLPQPTPPPGSQLPPRGGPAFTPPAPAPQPLPPNWGQPLNPPYMQPKPVGTATSLADLMNRAGNMGPNFGGAMPGAGGVGTYGPQPPPINWNLTPNQPMPGSGFGRGLNTSRNFGPNLDSPWRNRQQGLTGAIENLIRTQPRRQRMQSMPPGSWRFLAQNPDQQRNIY